MQEKLLTVSIAAYNVEPYLRETVASLLRQEDLIELLDILIVNDGSRDQTGEIAHELAARYPQSIRVIDQPNGGYGSTINASLQMARGRYYRLLDGDDWYDADSLRTFLRFLSDCASDLVITPYVEVRDQKTRVDAHPDIPARAISLGELRSASVSFAMHEITVRTEVLRRSGGAHCRPLLLYRLGIHLLLSRRVGHRFPVRCRRLSVPAGHGWTEREPCRRQEALPGQAHRGPENHPLLYGEGRIHERAKEGASLLPPSVRPL